MRGRVRFGPLVAIWGVLVMVGTATASGWNDYELPITDDLEIVRCNSLDVVLCGSDGGCLYVPQDYDGAGPITGYHVRPDRVFLRTAGRSDRNLFAGDTFQDVDPSRTFYFVLDRGTKALDGPLDATELAAAGWRAADEWTAPQNPSWLTPLAGSVCFLGVTVLIFSPIWVPLLGALWWAKRAAARRSRAAPQV